MSKILHPVLKRGHSNASHNVLMRFRSKHIFLERLHYQLSTMLQANLTPELYRCMQLPVFEGVEEALEKYNIKRKRALDKPKMSEAKKRRVQWKEDRVKDAERRKEWTKKHGHDTYGNEANDSEDVVVKRRKQRPSILVNAEHVVQIHTFAQTTRTALSISAEKPIVH